MEIRAGTRALNPGGVRLELSRSASPPELAEADRFFSADAFVVHGLTVHNVQGALGATLIAELKTTNTWHRHRYFPATLILRFPSNLKEWSTGTSTAFLELSSGYDRRQLEIAGRKIPVRTDTTTPLAYSLNGSFFWKLGRRQFFSSEEEIRSDVYLAQPYQPGRVPVVFVHGTFSSPVWWAEMVNSLQTDPVLSERCQFWYYIYQRSAPRRDESPRTRTALKAGGKARRWIHVVGFALIMATAAYVVIDLEFPRFGLIRVDATDRVLIEWRESMK